MATKTVFVCDYCNKFITEDEPGVIVKGNIYIANDKDVEDRVEIVGNNILNLTEATGKPTVTTIKENVYHLTCLIKILGEKKVNPTPGWPLKR